LKEVIPYPTCGDVNGPYEAPDVNNRVTDAMCGTDYVYDYSNRQSTCSGASGCNLALGTADHATCCKHTPCTFQTSWASGLPDGAFTTCSAGDFMEHGAACPIIKYGYTCQAWTCDKGTMSPVSPTCSKATSSTGPGVVLGPASSTVSCGEKFNISSADPNAVLSYEFSYSGGATTHYSQYHGADVLLPAVGADTGQVTVQASATVGGSTTWSSMTYTINCGIEDFYMNGSLLTWFANSSVSIGLHCENVTSRDCFNTTRDQTELPVPVGNQDPALPPTETCLFTGRCRGCLATDPWKAAFSYHEATVTPYGSAMWVRQNSSWDPFHLARCPIYQGSLQIRGSSLGVTLPTEVRAGQLFTLRVYVSLLSRATADHSVEVVETSGKCVFGVTQGAVDLHPHSHLQTVALSVTLSSSATQPSSRATQLVYSRCTVGGSIAIVASDPTLQYEVATYDLTSLSALDLYQAIPKYPFTTLFLEQDPALLQKGFVMELRLGVSNVPQQVVGGLVSIQLPSAQAGGTSCAISDSKSTAAAATTLSISYSMSTAGVTTPSSFYIYCSTGVSANSVTIHANQTTAGATQYSADTATVNLLPPTGCGNGTIDSDEACDDGNVVFGDGCSSTCQVEVGWSCTTGTSPPHISVFLGWGLSKNTSTCIQQTRRWGVSPEDVPLSSHLRVEL